MVQVLDLSGTEVGFKELYHSNCQGWNHRGIVFFT